MPRVALNEFIRERRAEILRDWARTPLLPNDIDGAVLDPYSALLDRIVETTELFLAGGTPSLTTEPHSVKQLDGAAELGEVVQRFSVLRDCITRLWHREARHIEELRE